MKSALILEQDSLARERIVEVLGWLGYVAAPVATPQQALRAAGVLRFDLIVTSMARQPNDRRLLTGELKRAAPGSQIVFIAANDEEYWGAKAGKYGGVSAVIHRPVSAEAMFKLIEYQLDGGDLAAAPGGFERERREKLP